MPSIRFGVDRVNHSPHLIGAPARVGLVTNDAARLAADPTRLSRRALIDAGIPIMRLFGPEHGLTARAADGASVADGIDTETGLSVTSLYGERMRPTRDVLADLDLVLFDIPDVGARFYTYTWTLYHVMSACAEFGVPLTILDRPNPLGGNLHDAEGPMLAPDCHSFLGEANIPLTHQLTLGELARLWQREQFAACALDVITCDGWHRSARWPSLGIEWVPTSPSMPSFESASRYPGMCLFEATNLSVGRGTSTPFLRLGAPWLDAHAFIHDASTRQQIELVRDDFTPSLAPYAAEHCVGVRLYDAASHRPVVAGLALLASAIATQHEHFAWARYPTAANPSGEDHFARLIGDRAVRPLLDARADSLTLGELQSLTTTADWASRVAPALLYT